MISLKIAIFGGSGITVELDTQSLHAGRMAP